MPGGFFCSHQFDNFLCLIKSFGAADSAVIFFTVKIERAILCIREDLKKEEWINLSKIFRKLLWQNELNWAVYLPDVSLFYRVDVYFSQVMSKVSRICQGFAAPRIAIGLYPTPSIAFSSCLTQFLTLEKQWSVVTSDGWW